MNCSGFRDLNRGRAFGFGPFFVLNPGAGSSKPEQLFWFSCPASARPGQFFFGPGINNFAAPNVYILKPEKKRIIALYKCCFVQCLHASFRDWRKVASTQPKKKE